MSRHGEMGITYTRGNLARFQIEIFHDELNKYQLIKGDDQYIVMEKANAKMAQWDETWEKKYEKVMKSQDKEQKKQLAIERTKEAQSVLASIEGVLAHTLSIDDTIDWDALESNDPFSEIAPGQPEPPVMNAPPPTPDEPNIKDSRYRVESGLLDNIFSSKRKEKEQKASNEFKRDHKLWKKMINKRNLIIAQEKKRYQAELESQQHEFQRELRGWKGRRDKYLQKREQYNMGIREEKDRYFKHVPDAIIQYCDKVLQNSEYPDFFPKDYELDRNTETKILLVEYQLPSIEDLPTLKEVKYVQSRDEFDEKDITKPQVNKMYDSLLYQVALRTVHELFEADAIDALDSIVFNGFVRSKDPATGKETNGCVLSLQVNKDEFLELNLEAIEPKACFKKLKGVGSSKLHSLTPVAPIMTIDREDKRFVPSYDVADTIEEGDNLAAMDWEDFEHPIRELFEKEFSEQGGEVKVTRASRDGGIDAVIFDPDPLRGGKIVLQAKRYTNTVGVSAVRDLYGTLMNEGANKGILVSTADYGPDAYSFAKGKPLVLLNGANLLHLLEKHGHKAKIDLKEAKMILAERED